MTNTQAMQEAQGSYMGNQIKQVIAAAPVQPSPIPADELKTQRAMELADSLDDLEHGATAPEAAVTGDMRNSSAVLSRERFEAWDREHYDIDASLYKRIPDGPYRDAHIRNRWETWQAALSTPSPQAPVAQAADQRDAVLRRHILLLAKEALKGCYPVDAAIDAIDAALSRGDGNG